MFQKTYKYIGIIAITLILSGHHSFQVSAMDIQNHHNQDLSCLGHDCHHAVSMEICEKIQSDEMQVSSDTFILDTKSGCIFDQHIENNFVPDQVYCTYLEQIPISQKQLARSHL